MKRRSVLAGALALPFVGRVAPKVAASEYVTARVGWPELPAGASLVPIAEGTVADLTAASAVMAVTRNVFDLDYGVVGSNFGDGTLILYVQEGTIMARPVLAAPDALPTLLVDTTAALDGLEPKLVMPDTRLDLSAGSLLATPADTGISLHNFDSPDGVTCFIVTMFPSGPVGALNYGSATAQLEIDLGIETVRDMAPPIVAASRLTLKGKITIDEHRSVWPRMLVVESGELLVTCDAEWLIHRRQKPPYNVGQGPVAPREATLQVGDGAYLPLGAAVSVVSGGEAGASALSLTVAPPR